MSVYERREVDDEFRKWFAISRDITEKNAT